MLENRDYMRQPTFESRRPLTIVLLIINAVAFVFQSIAEYYLPSLPLYEYFALSVEGLRQGFVWQLLTFQFMHGGLLHLLINAWVIYVFGRGVEEALGRRNFLVLYLLSGGVGGVLQVLGQLVLPGHFGTSVVGASAGAFGLVAAFAMLYPERPLTMLLLFILPVTMRAKFLLLFVALLSLFGILFPGDRVAHAAHLGGMLMGIFYVQQIIHWQWEWPRSSTPLRRPPRELVKVGRPKPGLWQRQPPESTEDLPPDEFISKEVDPILDKISAHGIHSLTERERKILEAARKKMGQR